MMALNCALRDARVNELGDVPLLVDDESFRHALNVVFVGNARSQIGSVEVGDAEFLHKRH